MLSKKDIIVVFSGGMDSTTLLWTVKDMFGSDPILAVSFDYGQRHIKELIYAEEQALLLNVDHIIIDLSGFGQYLRSALTTKEIAVPDGHYAEESMKKTVVPNRNSIFLNIAAAVVITTGATRLFTAVHAGDHFIYPDCRLNFLISLEETLKLANEGFLPETFQLLAPFVTNTKAEIAEVGDTLGVDWAQTWSCYKGEEVHCGTCGTCGERRLAFLEKEIADPTLYKIPLTEKEFLAPMFEEMVKKGIFSTPLARELNLWTYAESYGLVKKGVVDV